MHFEWKNLQSTEMQLSGDVTTHGFYARSFFFWLGTYPSKAEQPLKGMELEEKEEDKEEKCIRKLIRKSPKITGDYQL